MLGRYWIVGIILLRPLDGFLGNSLWTAIIKEVNALDLAHCPRVIINDRHAVTARNQTGFPVSAIGGQRLAVGKIPTTLATTPINPKGFTKAGMTLIISMQRMIRAAAVVS